MTNLCKYSGFIINRLCNHVGNNIPSFFSICDGSNYWVIIKDSLMQILLTNSHFSIYSTLLNAIDGETKTETETENVRMNNIFRVHEMPDIAIALCHYHDKPLLCTVSIYVGDNTVNKATPIPSFRVKWSGY